MVVRNIMNLSCNPLENPVFKEVEETMTRGVWILGILVITLGVFPAVGLAAEHGGQEHGGEKAAGSATSSDSAAADSTGNQQTTASAAAAPADVSQAPDVVVATAPASVPADAPVPVLKPIIITFTGELSSVDTNASPASMTVQDRYGVRKEIALPAEAKITQGSSAKAVSDLKVGDKLTVEYTYDVATGKRSAQSIVIGEAVSKPVTQ